MYEFLFVYRGHDRFLNFYDDDILQATDPENDPVSYSIVSGNDLRQFAIGDKSGVITVIRKLDREDLTRYQLVSSTPYDVFYYQLFFYLV